MVLRWFWHAECANPKVGIPSCYGVKVVLTCRMCEPESGWSPRQSSHLQFPKTSSFNFSFFVLPWKSFKLSVFKVRVMFCWQWKKQARFNHFWFVGKDASRGSKIQPDVKLPSTKCWLNGTNASHSPKSLSYFKCFRTFDTHRVLYFKHWYSLGRTDSWSG